MSEAKIPTAEEVKHQLQEKKSKDFKPEQLVENLSAIYKYSIVEPWGMYMLPTLYSKKVKSLADNETFYNICFPNAADKMYQRAGSVKARYPDAHVYWCESKTILDEWVRERERVVVVAPINTVEQYNLLARGEHPLVESGCKYLLFTSQERAVETMKKKLKFYRQIQGRQKPIFLFTNLPIDP